MPTTSYMGGTVRRREDPRLITGSATYVDDMSLPGMVYMTVLRSPYPHATILSIDSSEALAMPGVLTVITGDEVQHLVPPRQGDEDGESGPPSRTPLAVGKTRYVGDLVAAVIASDRGVAEDALEAIYVDYEELQGIGDAETSMNEGMPQIDPYTERNLDKRREFSAGDADAAFAAAHTTASVRMVSQRLSPNPMETRAVLAQYIPGSDSFTIWSSTQCAHFVRDAICDAMKMPRTRIRVIAPEVGGGFGCKIGAYPEDVLAAYLAKELHHPVKWIETRSEHMQSTVQGRSQIGYLDLAAEENGKITGLRFKLISDSGAYGAAWAAETTAGMVTGCYDIVNVYSEALTVLTNKTPLGAYRGAGRPEATYYIERAIDVLADKMNIDPTDIRRVNFIPPEAFPYQAPDWPVFDSGEYAATLDAALGRSGYAGLRQAQEIQRRQGRVIGIGLASYVEVCGFGWETSTVRMEEDGGVTIYTGISPHGQGQETTFAQMAADVLGVKPEQVRVLYGDTSYGSGFGTMGSRGTAVGGPAVYRASEIVREKMRQIAAHTLEAAPEDLELEDNAWRVRGAPDSFVTIEDIASKAYGGSDLPEGMEPGLTAVNNFRPEDVTAPFGTHVVMVEIDRDTGQISIEKFLTVDDCGTVISPQLVQGQVHGGIAQGIAQAIFEEVVYSEDGQLLTGSLVDYAIPSAADLPSYETTHTHTPSPRNTLGIKGIGEAATIGATPAVVNAVIDALSPFGVTHLDMPLTPEKVWRAMQSESTTGKSTAAE